MPEQPDCKPAVPTIFLCHSSADKPAVRALYHRLRGDGVNPWLDEEDLLPGHLWETEIPKAVRSSAAVIVCLSRSSIQKTGYLQKEIKYALDAADEQPEGKVFLIPAKLEECPVPDRLKHLHWVNLFEPNGYERLLRALAATGIRPSLAPISRKLRLTVHRAYFLPRGPECFFINATNLTKDSDLVVTHIWLATMPEIHVVREDRLLPKRLNPQETWETWIRVEEVPSVEADAVFNLARARLSTGDIVHSQRNDDVPQYGTVPGGPITRI
jgi:hypothetical protein